MPLDRLYVARREGVAVLTEKSSEAECTVQLCSMAREHPRHVLKIEIRRRVDTLR